MMCEPEDGLEEQEVFRGLAFSFGEQKVHIVFRFFQASHVVEQHGPHPQGFCPVVALRKGLGQQGDGRQVIACLMHPAGFFQVRFHLSFIF